jgi:hypothetical protein
MPTEESTLPTRTKPSRLTRASTCTSVFGHTYGNGLFVNA